MKNHDECNMQANNMCCPSQKSRTSKLVFRKKCDDSRKFRDHNRFDVSNIFCNLSGACKRQHLNYHEKLDNDHGFGRNLVNR